jgi:putative spermidine/putrescine transport system ATP-binding protein
VPGPGDALVRFVDVEKTYDGETLVIKRLTLDIERGEFLTLLGPSGSGKTTCLMMLAGFESPTHGEIFLDGRPMSRVPPHRRNIGVVFQNYALFPHMSAAENIAYPLRARGWERGKIAERVRRALDMVQLGGFGARRPAKLSGGQQQRVALARALVFEPQVVLMDEPLGALDRQLREQMQYEIKQIHDRLAVTVVYVTHDQGEALVMSDRIAVMHRGAVEQVASPAVLYDEPQNAFVARFIGENNALPGTVVAADGERCVVRLESGDVVRAVAVRIRGVGTRTSLSLRPECVVVWPTEGLCPNVVDATVRDVVYLGDHGRVHLQTLGRDDFVVKLGRPALGEAKLRAGAPIRIGWATEDCRALDAPDAGPDR